jgi:hypothetical protein
MMLGYYEEDRLATPADACREYAATVGAEYPAHAWILTDYDTWEPNPHYQGKPVPHPEWGYDMTEEELEAWGDRVIQMREKEAFDRDLVGPKPLPELDDIPF